MKRLLAVALLALLAFPAQAQNAFRLFTESGGQHSSLVRTAPLYVDARVLAAAANESHTVPAGVKYVIFSMSCAAFYAKPGGTAAVPAADVTDGSGSELNPGAWYVDGMTAIGLISPTTCTVTLSFYK
jgi:hypothetical protein